jgi:hypothetical protein
MKPQEAIDRVSKLGPVQFNAFFQDEDVLMQVVSQLPYVSDMMARAGTECHGFSNQIGDDGTVGFSLVTGGDLTREEAIATNALMAKYAQTHTAALPRAWTEEIATAIRRGGRERFFSFWGILLCVGLPFLGAPLELYIALTTNDTQAKVNAYIGIAICLVWLLLPVGLILRALLS